MLCLYCEGTQLKKTELEIRRVNALTMAISSREKVIEVECLDCGWIDSMEPEYATA
jgi:hypothetical protein